MKYLDWQKLIYLAEMWEKGYLNSLETLFKELKGQNVTDTSPKKLVKWSRIAALYNGTKLGASIEEQRLTRQLKDVTSFMDKFSVDVLLMNLSKMENPPNVLREIDYRARENPNVGGDLVEIADPTGQSDLKLSFYVYDVDGKGEVTLLPADLIDKDC
ncbi:hypothetical protein IT412_01805 [Candidatus Peregrinibacteria bacterium]|nr:hypothetical protein [Candidatus Peregrinibacteria bacterium]